ncbi:hypothetical protein NL676_026044 [Syzygium grande]|nr:hypothetical protein NL676_026044 [Syzygium grande]
MLTLYRTACISGLASKLLSRTDSKVLVMNRALSASAECRPNLASSSFLFLGFFSFSNRNLTALGCRRIPVPSARFISSRLSFCTQNPREEPEKAGILRACSSRSDHHRPEQTMPANDGFSGVSNCYVFKSRLQEYAQKVGRPTPVYETIKEGPSHEPSFRSTVIVNDVRYDSLPGFFNRKAAEQSAAEVALLELAKSGEISDSISQPVHETGLCKNLLQEYAQKMNYAIPPRGIETATNAEDAGNPPKAKKARFKKKSSKRKLSVDKLGNNQIQNTGNPNLRINDPVPSGVSEGASGPSAGDLGLNTNGNETERCVDIAPVNALNFQNLQCLASNFNQGNLGTQGTLLVPHEDASTLLRETNNISGVNEVASAANYCSGCANMENSSGIVGFD